jgi:hypothetical protein
MMNAHVLLYLRWQIWQARALGRPLAETALVDRHNREWMLASA